MAVKKPSSKDSGIDFLKKELDDINKSAAASVKDNPAPTDKTPDINDNVLNMNPDTKSLEDELNANLSDDTSTPESNLNTSLSLTQLGSVYTIERINSSLKSLDLYIDDAIIKYPKSTELVNLKMQLSDIEDKFILLSNNIEKYLDKLDYIIEIYREYIVTLSKYLSNKYKLD